MSNPPYDVIVVGLGAMGSAAAFHLARSGRRTLGIDRFAPPHDLGSSHGRSRIIREAYFEHPVYVPLVRHAYRLWAELEARTGRRLLLPTGGLMIGPPDGALVRGARLSADTHGLAYETLPAAELRRRYPLFDCDDETVAIWEPRAGVLYPEACIEAHLDQARAAGATLRLDEEVFSWSAGADDVEITTPSGRYAARQLVLTAGPWIRRLVPELRPAVTIQRQTLFWFAPRSDAEAFAPDRFPVFIFEHERGRFFYGFPDLGDGIKVAIHHEGEATEPDQVRREVGDDEVTKVRAILARRLPAAAGALRSSAVCMYTNTPDEHFLIDRHPAHANVLIVSPCSGHGFKFSAAIGDLIATWSRGEEPVFDLSLFGRR